MKDLGELGVNWVTAVCNGANDWCGQADIDRSGEVDLNDLSVIAGQWLLCSNPLDINCSP